MILPQFTAPGYMDRTLNDVQRCVNWYHEKTPDGWSLISMPGLTLIGVVANNEPCRGANYSSIGRLFSVHDNDLYELTSVGSTDYGNLSTTTGKVGFCDNGIKMLIVDGTNGYVYDFGTDVLTTIVDGNFPSTPNGCVFKDGYFIVTEQGSDTYYLSQLNDPSDWTPATSAQAESSGDNIEGCVNSGNEVLLLGVRTVEPIYNTGNGDFPFERITGSIKKLGVEEIRSVAVDGPVVYMIAVSDSVGPSAWAITAGEARKISTPYIDTLIASGGVLDGFIYQWEGHTFYQVNQSVRSLVYDITVGVWSEKDSDISSSYSVNRIIFAVNRGRGNSGTIACDRINGSFYFVTGATNSEAGTAIRRIKDWRTGDGIRTFFYDRIEIVAEMDHDSSASYTASGTLSWSDDGGLSFNTPITLSVSVTSGTTGQLLRFTNNRMGSSDQYRIWRWTMAGPAARIILKSCDLQYRVGR